MNSIYVIDALNILFRNYYAIGPMTNPEGESTNALFGFIRSIFKIIKDFSPTHIAIVFDGPDNKKRRQEVYAEYKAHRASMPEDLFPQLERALQFCELAGLPFLSVPGVEADDTMASIAKWASLKGSKVYICTSDKDMCQLVNGDVYVINVNKDNLLVDREKVKEIYGVTPEQIPDFLGMTGDSSDNIPGLEGFGPKTAATLLEKFSTLEEILEKYDQVPGEKKQQTLKEGREIALMSKQLAILHTDVEFPHEESFFQFRQPDVEKIKAFYLEMRFMTLLKEMGETPAASPEHFKEEKDVHYELVNDEVSFYALIDKLKMAKEICIDTESTDLRPMIAQIVGIGFSIEPKQGYYVPFNGAIDRSLLLHKIQELFSNPDIGFFGHNIKYDLHVLCNAGLFPKKISFDTMIASYLINPQSMRHNLDLLSLERFGKIKTSIEELIGKGKKQISMSDVPIEKVSDYCCEDVDYSFRLKKLFSLELEKLGLTPLFEKIELPLIHVLFSMERHGIYVDPKKLEKMSEELTLELQKLEHNIHQLAGETFNINSTKQLGKILFEKLGIPPPKKTLTGFSTSAEVLELIEDSSPIVKEVIEYRTLEKLRSTYVDSLPQEINPHTGRIHCTFNQSVTATGRLSCQDPNLQNIPIRSEISKKLREAFKPQKPGLSFLSADYSQIELRLLAHFSEDPTLIAAFSNGTDVHTYTASLVFEIPIDQVTPEMRMRAKAVNFGILYGQQAFGLAAAVGIEYKEAAAFIDRYFERYPKVKEYLTFCKESVRKTGRAVTLTGRQRPIPEIHSKNAFLRAAAERLAINTPLQGSQADLIKIAMIQIDQMVKEEKMLLQIHDELLFEIPDEKVAHFSKQVKNIMENAMSLKVPLVVDISVGKNWGEC